MAQVALVYFVGPKKRARLSACLPSLPTQISVSLFLRYLYFRWLTMTALEHSLVVVPLGVHTYIHTYAKGMHYCIYCIHTKIRENIIYTYMY